MRRAGASALRGTFAVVSRVGLPAELPSAVVCRRSLGVLATSRALLARKQPATGGAASATTADGSSSSSSSSSSSASSATSEDASAMLGRAAEARRRINELWLRGSFPGRGTEARALMAELGIQQGVPRERDVSAALGEALDRLLLMLVPLEGEDAAAVVTLLDLAARNDAKISLRTIQHLFARSANYTEAIGIFHAMREARVSLSMDAYYAMIYCLQRLEEESWGQRHFEEAQRNGGRLSDDALSFVLRGCDNQLLPEDKPWLGRVMFGRTASSSADAAGGTDASFDDLSNAWVERYKGGQRL